MQMGCRDGYHFKAGKEEKGEQVFKKREVDTRSIEFRRPW